MSVDPNARWTTDWLETLDGDRLRALSSALFSRIGYHVHPMAAPSDLNFELSQEAPMAPRVGLSCRTEAEGIDIPFLRKIDAAVSQNDHGFGIVAKNGKFRPEEKMFAQGKPLQLIDSNEFVKRLEQLPPELQESIFKEFAPTPPPSPNRQDPTGAAKGVGGTPDFIKKLENVPGFGNKKAPLSSSSVRDSSSPSSQDRETVSRTPDPSGASSAGPQPVIGLNLAKAISSPASPAAGSRPPGLAPMSHSLPPIQQPNRPTLGPGAPVASTRPLIPARTTDSGPIAAPEGRIAPPAAPLQESRHTNGGTPPRLRSSEGQGMASSAPSSISSESGNLPAQEGVDATSTSDSLESEPSMDGVPITKNRQGVSSPFPSPQSSTSGEQPPDLAESGASSPPIPIEADQDAPPVSTSPSRKQRVPALAVISIFLLMIPVIGGFFAFKLVFGSKPQQEVVLPLTPAQLQLPQIDQEEVENLTKALAKRVTELKQVTAGIEGREAALKVASEATRALKAGIDFVALGNDDLIATVAALIEGEVIDDPDRPENGEAFGSLKLGDVSLELVANYLVIEDGLLKFSMVERDPRLAVAPGDEAATGEELLIELETLLNRQQVVGAQANAKSLAEVAAAAKASGLDFTAAGRRDINKTIAAIVSGETVTNHVETGENMHFALPNLSEKAQHAAASYLQFAQGELVYVSDPLPAPTPAFDLVGKDILYDLERAESIAEKAVAHVQGRLPSIESDSAALAADQEAILALTGEPERVTFSSGSIAFLLPRDFNYELEEEDSILITPKYTQNKDAIWLRVRLQSSEGIQVPDDEPGILRLRSLAKSLGRPVEKLGDKIFYWKNDEVLEGDQLYWVTSRHVGFGNTIVIVADATAKGMENLPEVARLQEVLPAIIESLRETGAPRRELESVDAREATPHQSEKQILPGRSVPR